MAKPKVEVEISGTDKTKPAFQKAAEGIDGFKGKIVGLFTPLSALKTAIAGLGVAALGGLLKKAVESAMGAESAWTRVATSLENIGITGAGVRGELDGLFASIQKTTRFSDDDAADAFATLVTVSGDYANSVKNLSLVADVAAKKQIDMVSAADLVGKVMAGTGARGLKEFGIATTDTAAGLEELRAKLKGFAENDGATFEGRLHQIANAFDNVLEAIGRAVMGGDGASGGMNSFADALNKFAEWIDQNSAPIKSFVDDIGRLAGYVIEIAKFVPKGFQTLRSLGIESQIAASGRDAFGREKKVEPFAGPPQGAGRDFGGENDPEVQKQRNAERVASEVAERARVAREAVAKKEAEKAKKEQAESDRLMNDFNKAGLSGGSLYHPMQLTPILGDQQKINVQGPTSPDVSLEPIGPQFGDFGSRVLETAAAVEELNGKMGTTGEIVADLATDAAFTFADAWVGAIDEVIRGHERLGTAILKAARQAVAGALAAEGRRALIEAAIAAARGLTNPVEFLKAARLFAAGTAAIGAAAAIGGGGGGGGGGYGGGGGGSYSAGFNQAADGVAGQGKVTVYLNGKKTVLDHTDPNDLAQLKEMIQQLAGTREVEFVFRNEAA